MDGLAFIYGVNLPSSSKTYATKVTTTAIGIVADEMGARTSATSPNYASVTIDFISQLTNISLMLSIFRLVLVKKVPFLFEIFLQTTYD